MKLNFFPSFIAYSGKIEHDAPRGIQREYYT